MTVGDLKRLLVHALSNDKKFKTVFIDEMQKIIRVVTVTGKEFTISVDSY